jgi:hypothetical protein
MFAFTDSDEEIRAVSVRLCKIGSVCATTVSRVLSSDTAKNNTRCLSRQIVMSFLTFQKKLLDYE